MLPTDEFIPAYKRLLRTMALVALVLLAVSAIRVYLAHIDWPARPDPLPFDIAHAVDTQPDLVDRAYVYNFWGNFIDTQQLWKIEVKPELVPLLVHNLGVPELASAYDLPIQFWRQAPYWWKPNRKSPGRFFMTPGFDPIRREGDGTFYLIVHDETAGILYVWYKNNF